MSLVAWYPLHKDFKDWSGNKLHLTNDDNLTKISDGGLFGKGAHFPNNPACRVHYDDFPIPEGDISVSIWFKAMSDHNPATGSNIGMILSLGRDYNDGNDYGVSICIESNHTLIVYYGVMKHVILTDLEHSRWYNLSIIRTSNNKVRIYLDNELKLDIETPRSSYYYKNLYLGKLSYKGEDSHQYFPFNGFINDIRIYNHALSIKERKDIYDAKMIHYKFNDPYEIPTTNLHTSEKTYKIETASTYDNPSEHKYIFVKNIDDHVLAGIYFFMSEYGDVDDYVTLSYKFRKIRGTLKSIRSHSDLPGNTVSYVDGEKYSLTDSYELLDDYDIHEVIQIHKIGEGNNALYIQPNYSRATPVQVEIFDIQITRTNNPRPFTNRVRNLPIADCSGLKNNAHFAANSGVDSLETAMMDISYEERNDGYGSGCLKSGSDNGTYIRTDEKFKMDHDFTISITLSIDKFHNFHNIFHMITEDKQDADNMKCRIQVWGSNNKVISFSPEGAIGEAYSYYDNELNNMVTYTWVRENNNLLLFIGGKLIKSFNIENSGLNNAMYLIMLGQGYKYDNYRTLKGCISDFRVYSRAFTQEEIKNICNIKTRVGKDGTLYTNEVVEHEAFKTISKVLAKDEYLSTQINKDRGYIYFKDGDDELLLRDPIDMRDFLNCDNDLTDCRFTVELKSNVPGLHISSFEFDNDNLQTGYGTVRMKHISDLDDGWALYSQDILSNYNGDYVDPLNFRRIQVYVNNKDLVPDEGLELGFRNLTIYRDIVVDDGFKPSVEKNGVVNCSSISNNTIDDLGLQGFPTKVRDGKRFYRIFMQDIEDLDNGLFVSGESVHMINTDCKQSDLWALEKFRDSNNKLTFMLEYPTLEEIKDEYILWEQTTDPNDTDSPKNIEGLNVMHNGYSTKFYGMYKRTSYSYYCCSAEGTWKNSIGTRSLYRDHDTFPGPDIYNVKRVELWVSYEHMMTMKFHKDGGLIVNNIIED